MSSTDVADQDFDLRKNLEYTNGIYKQIAGEMLKDGLPCGKEDRDFLMSSLAAIDRQTLTTMRIKTENDSAKAQRGMADLVAKMLMERKSIMSKAALQGPGDRDLTIDHSTGEIVDGEMSTEITTFTYDEIMKQEL